ncbi:histidine phosphatase family protein [Pseudonocardia pini]|uniref:histidine phosphatase family protein n=1 Tax=Pseudonocardia pini TaxID=2758030 RepID=UPI0015F01556|nr:histidine phosphatase family protein [Pseudonocardia pini]
MELLLIRHARPEHVHGGSEPADPPLTARGRDQARLLSKAVADGAFGTVDAVVSSTMRRARQTAEPVVQALGLVLQTDVRLCELDLGWTTYGTGVEDMSTRRAAYDEMNAGRWGTNRYDPAAFTARVRAGVEDVVAAHAGRAAIVCHGGVVSAYLAHLLGTPGPMFLTPDHCSVTRVLAEPDGYREVLSVNETLHMREP